MIDITIKKYLEKALSVPCRFEAFDPDETEPGEYILIERVGSQMRNRVRTVSFAFQSYSLNSMQNAAELDLRVVNAMTDAPDHVDTITASHMVTEYNHTDTRTKKYRYQCTFDITFYE